MNEHAQVVIGGDTTPYQRSLGGMEGMTKSAASRIGGMFAALGISALMFRMGRSFISYASDISIAARNTQILTEELIALNRIGLQAGVEMGQMARMLARMQSELFRAARDGGEAAKKFEQMGLSVQELAAMDPAAMLQRVAKAAFDSGMPLQHLTDLFGERLGPTAMTALRDLAQNGLPEVSASAGDTADSIEALGSAIARMADVIKSELLVYLDMARQGWEGIAAAVRGFFSVDGGMGARIDAAKQAIFEQVIAEERAQAARREGRERERKDAREQLAEMAITSAASRDAAAAEKERADAKKEADAAMQRARQMDMFYAGQSAQNARPEFQSDSLRRIGAMRDTGTAQQREPIMLDRARNQKLDAILQAIREMEPIDLGADDLAMR